MAKADYMNKTPLLAARFTTDGNAIRAVGNNRLPVFTNELIRRSNAWQEWVGDGGMTCYAQVSINFPALRLKINSVSD